ncbi:hypothetical protein ACQCU3_03730 [Bacillus altitudinis]|uniref:hypothetical protein n=1 Tax=Bacillus TaxID=1386 RepID=UPI0011E929A0|nr:hypothetical protein [Bacillus altitudinis]TYS30609.1 hypothetical protein FZC69_01750 [Bacillus altitudinis]
MKKQNNWVWTKLTEKKHPDRKAGTPVHTAYMREGDTEYHPHSSWIDKGYIEHVDSLARHSE